MKKQFSRTSTQQTHITASTQQTHIETTARGTHTAASAQQTHIKTTARGTHIGKAGLARAVILLVCAVVIVLAIVVTSAVRSYQQRRARFLCSVSLDRAHDSIVLDYLEEASQSEAEALAVASDETVLCPSGGDCYLVPQGGTYLLVCGLHDLNVSRRVHTNAVTALDRTRQALHLWYLTEVDAPETLSITLNGISRTVQVTADRDASEKDGLYCQAEGETVTWFCYLEDAHRTTWTPSDGWRGEGAGTIQTTDADDIPGELVDTDNGAYPSDTDPYSSDTDPYSSDTGVYPTAADSGETSYDTASDSGWGVVP